MEQIIIFDSFQQVSSNRVSATMVSPYNGFEELKVDIAGTSENLQYNFVGLDSNGSVILDLYWYNSGTIIQIPYTANLVSWTLWVRKSGDGGISPSDVTSCTATCSILWEMGDDGIPTNYRFIEPVDKAICEPYPKGMWRVTDAGVLMQELLPKEIDFGAFANAYNLRQVSIPRTCKKIGRYAFRNTRLSSVTIASDCVYYNTSFPDECVVNFYPD